LGSFNQNQRSKLFPIGVVPYTIIIKNNKGLINYARTSWDFLLSKKLTGKIIFPQSPRIILSIAQKINSYNSLKNLIKYLFICKHSLDKLKTIKRSQIFYTFSSSNKSYGQIYFFRYS